MKVIKVLLAVILSIIFTIILTGGIFAYTIDSFVSKENIRTIFDQIEFEEFFDHEIENDPEIDKFVENFIKAPEMKEIIADLFEQAMDYVFTDQDVEVPRISDEDIEKIVNSDFYETELGITLSEAEKTELREHLVEVAEDVNETLANDLKSIKDEIYEDEILKFIFSSDFISTIIISLMIIAVLIVACRWSIFRPFSWLGISMIVAACLNISLNFLTKLIFATGESDALTNNFFDNMLSLWLRNSLIILGLGIILLVNYFILKKRFGKTENDKLLENL